MPSLVALPGTSDLLPEETARWQAVDAAARAILARYDYREIRTPIIESAEVFLRSLGDATEIVQKQMYLFTDRGGRQVALRPEGTASAVRAYLEHGLDKTAGLVKWYYVGPMFRAERPQKGRQRQFHQLGVEVFGSASPLQDAEVIALLMHLLEVLGVKGAALKLNNLGCRQDRAARVEALTAFFSQHVGDLCEDCQQRLRVNPLRILDCKQEKCQRIVAKDRTPDTGLCADCLAHWQAVLAALDALNIRYERDVRLVRGLDYYTRTAFEVVHPGLGAQDALGGGGRYDDLVQQMGGPSVPAIGFALGLERVLMAMDHEGVPAEPVRPPDVCIAALGEAAQIKGLVVRQDLRRAGVACAGELDPRPLKRQLEAASKLGCPLVLLLGDDELAKEVVTIRDMQTRSQAQVPQAGCVNEVVRRLKTVNS